MTQDIVFQVSEIEFKWPSVKRRMACWLYEGILLFGIVFISGYLFSALSQSKHGLSNRWGLQVFVGLVLGVYFTWFWFKGQTLAMKTWGIRIVDLKGQKLSQKKALLRYFFSWIWFVPPLAFCGLIPIQGFSVLGVIALWIVIWANLSQLHPHQQFWHDHWAGSCLVQSSSADH